MQAQGARVPEHQKLWLVPRICGTRAVVCCARPVICRTRARSRSHALTSANSLCDFFSGASILEYFAHARPSSPSDAFTVGESDRWGGRARAAAGCPRPAVNGRGPVVGCARTRSMRDAGNIWIARVNICIFTSRIRSGVGVAEGCVPARTNWGR